MKYEIKEIWSGGQYGVDISALAAAKQCGLKTCGWAPKGFKTCYGPRPQLAKLGLIEHESPRYECRTYANVRDTDGTLLICKDWKSPGTICTFKAINFYEKKFFKCDLNDLPSVIEVFDWLQSNNIVKLNVAGNRGKDRQESSLIFNQVSEYLNKVFKYALA
jgi:hypothetical protein